MRFLILLSFLFPLASFGQAALTLEESVRQAIQVSPQIKAAGEQIKSAQGSVSQSGAWPNPTVGVVATNKLGIDEGTGGNDLTQLSISQTIPLGRLTNARGEAKALLKASQYDRVYQQLQFENIVAKAFHRLQITEAKFKLAQEQLVFADRHQPGRKGADSLVRYLSPLEKKRLLIIRELAAQEVASTEGEYGEAQSGLGVWLQSANATPLVPAALTPYTQIDDLSKIKNEFPNHSALASSKLKVQAAEAALSIEKGKRIPDLTLTAFRELDSLAGSRQNFTGVGIGLTIPIWDFNSGAVSKARAESAKIKYERQALEQELSAEVVQTHTHLGHLVEQSQHYRNKILKTTEEVFKLTTKSFRSGEVNVLGLVDASSTYFDARERYLELLYESWVEAADLRLASGQSLLKSSSSGGAL